MSFHCFTDDLYSLLVIQYQTAHIFMLKKKLKLDQQTLPIAAGTFFNIRFS